MKKLLPYAFFISCFGVLVYVLIPSVGRTCGDFSPVIAQSVQVRSVAVAVSTWMTGARNGKMRIAESLDVIDSNLLSDELRHYQDPLSGERDDWLYYGAYLTTSDPSSQTILVAVPHIYYRSAHSGQREASRVVAYLDGHTEVLLESEFQQKVEAMLKRKAEKLNRPS